MGRLLLRVVWICRGINAQRRYEGGGVAKEASHVVGDDTDDIVVSRFILRPIENQSWMHPGWQLLIGWNVLIDTNDA